MSIKTIKQICAVEYFPDLCVIGRCCLEVSASLNVVLSNGQAANDYLEFEKHSKSNHYKKFLKKSGKNEKIVQAEEHLREIGVENPDDYKWDKWCARLGGYSKLVADYKGPDEREIYSFFSTFTHGSVDAMKNLENLQSPTNFLELVVKSVYSDYNSTKSFLDTAWGQIITDNSEDCKGEFCEIARLSS